MWALVWRPALTLWLGYGRIRAESARSISRTGHRNRQKVTRFCLGKVLQSGKTFLKQRRAPAGAENNQINKKERRDPNPQNPPPASQPSFLSPHTHRTQLH